MTDSDRAQTSLLNGLQNNSTGTQPSLQLTRELPKDLNPKAIERAVERFLLEVDCKGDWVGFFNQTIQKIASATFLRMPGHDFWCATQDGEVAGYALASVVNDIDGSLCYWAAQCWVDPKFRTLACVKEGYDKIFDYAKSIMCRYVVLVSTRDDKAYCRFLGRGAHKYASLLKVDLN